jgi:hypothetical protein
MKKGILFLTAIVILSITGAGFAAGDGELGVTLDTTWVSKYIWRGIDRLDDKAAFQPSIDLDLFGTGFSANVWTSQAGASKNGGNISTVDAEEWNYSLAYNNTINEGDTTAVNYSVWYRFYDFPDMASKDADAQEVALAVSLPNICPGGVVPSYAAIRMWNSKSGGAASGLGGWIHVFALNYGLVIDGFEPTIDLGWDLTYNDGAGVGGGVVSHDWSHMTWSVGSSFDVGPGTFTPAIYFQNSMDDSVNDEDEIWTSLSYTMKF